MVEKNVQTLKMVTDHYRMLDLFSFMYKESDIETFWYMKMWPIKIQVSMSYAKDMISRKIQFFGEKIDEEKELFEQQIVEFKEQFAKIKELKKLTEVEKFFLASHELKKQLERAFA